MKNWSTTKKILVALLVIAAILVIYNWNSVSKKFGIGSSTRQYRAGGGLGFVPAIPGGGGVPITPVERPGSILNYPTINTAYHKCDEADVLLASHGVHGQCIGKNGTVNY